MALGDSIAAGYKLAPITEGYTYLLYQDGVFDRMPHTLFNNVSAVGATSLDVLQRQVPQALIPVAIGGFHAQYITLTVGGNDILSILRYAAAHPNDPGVILFAQTTLAQYAQNLSLTLAQLIGGLPGVKIFVANQYTIPELDAIAPGTSQIINAFNATTQQVVGAFAGHAFLVDVYGAFLGRRNLLWLDRTGTLSLEVHPTSVGHRVMEQAFEDVIDANK
jgi:lysophospholipase L1-like esterase